MSLKSSPKNIEYIVVHLTSVHPNTLGGAYDDVDGTVKDDAIDMDDWNLPLNCWY